jgi:hypothetical protein
MKDQADLFKEHVEDLAVIAEAPIIDAEYELILSSTRLDPLLEFKAPPACIEIMAQDGKRAIFGTLGNISAIKGRAKVSKTMLVSIIVAAAMRNGSIATTVFCNFPKNQRGIVWFDTEQIEHDIWRSVRRATTLAGGRIEEAVENLDVHALRELTPDERIKAIDYYLSTRIGIGLVIIDGIRDLLDDINDPGASNRCIQWFLKWSKKYNVHIITVLHQNKGAQDKNMRGHIGTELTNKAETVIEITRDGRNPDQRIVAPAECRNMEFPEFAFLIDSFGVPRINEDFIAVNPEAPAKGQKANDFPDAMHRQILRVCFKSSPEQGSEELTRSIQAAFASLNISVSERNAKVYISHYEQNDFVNKSKARHNKYIYSLKVDDMPF